VVKKLTQFLTLFTSFSTLICCALPALLVSLGLGAAMAGFLSKYPQLIWISEHKLIIFIVGGVLLALGGYLQFSKPKECPIDYKEACEETKDWSKPVYIVSVVIYLIGFAFAYILPYFL
jgi:hypothetical protein